ERGRVRRPSPGRAWGSFLLGGVVALRIVRSAHVLFVGLARMRSLALLLLLRWTRLVVHRPYCCRRWESYTAGSTARAVRGHSRTAATAPNAPPAGSCSGRTRSRRPVRSSSTRPAG